LRMKATLAATLHPLTHRLEFHGFNWSTNRWVF